MHYTSLCLAFDSLKFTSPTHCSSWSTKQLKESISIQKRSHGKQLHEALEGISYSTTTLFFLSKIVTYKKRKNKIKPYYFEPMTLLFITPSPTILSLCSTDQNLKSKHYSKKCMQNFSQLPAKCH